MAEQQQKLLKQNGKGSIRRFLGNPTETIRTAIAERKEDQDGKKEALALLEDCKTSRLAALTKANSSTTHLSAPSPLPSPWAKPAPTIESASIVRIVRHSTLVSMPAEKHPSQEQLKRPAMSSRSSSGSILKNSSINVPTLDSIRRGSRKGSAVSWTTPSLGQISEGVADTSTATTPFGDAEGTVPLSPAMARECTKMFRRVSWSSGEEEYEEIVLDGHVKQVILVWGEGVDEIIP